MERTHEGYAESAEPRFRYLNRSARPEWSAIRDVLDVGFIHYPDDHKVDLRGRFRSEDDRAHLGSFFELYCLTLLRAHGFEAEIHPPLGGRNATPDFLVRRGGQPILFLESTLAADSNQAVGESKRLTGIVDAIDRIDSPNFLLHVDKVKPPPANVRVSALVAKLKSWLPGHDPDEVIRQCEAEGDCCLPRFDWTDRASGWSIRLIAFLTKPEARGLRSGRNIGSRSSEMEFIDDRGSLLNALKGKASGYGELAAPYVIAVNATDQRVDEDGVLNALFGQEHALVNGRTGQARMGRCRNGFWVSGAGPSNRRVSGVLVVRQLVPFSIATAEPVLWHNPWATYPVDPGTWRGKQMIPDHAAGCICERAGACAAELLGLPNGWPPVS